MRIGTNQDDAHFAGRNRSEVELKAVTPNDLYELAPRRGGVMPAESEPLRVAAARIEAGPSTDAGISAVGSDDPARRDVFETADALAPEKAHAGIPGALQKARVQRRPAQSEAAAVRERRFGNALSVAE